MQVILFQDVKNLGRQGDVIKVAEGYYRNFLKPKGLAEEANAVNTKRLEALKKKQLQLAAEQEAEARTVAKRLENVTITLKAKAGDSDQLFGSITQQNVAEALTEQGYTVDKKQIEMEDHIKKLGLFTIGVRIHPQVEGKFKLLVERA